MSRVLQPPFSYRWPLKRIGRVLRRRKETPVVNLHDAQPQAERHIHTSRAIVSHLFVTFTICCFQCSATASMTRCWSSVDKVHRVEESRTALRCLSNAPRHRATMSRS